jgi:hypothetical protein
MKVKEFQGSTPSRPAWRVPLGAAVGFCLFGAAGYCWNQSAAHEQPLPNAIATIERGRDDDDRRGAIMVAVRETRRCVLALQQAAARDDKAAEHARAALRQIHQLTQEARR